MSVSKLLLPRLRRLEGLRKIWYNSEKSISVDENEELLKKGSKPVLLIESKGHALHAFVNQKYLGTAYGNGSHSAFTFKNPISLKAGKNEIALLSLTVGLQQALPGYKYLGERRQAKADDSQISELPSEIDWRQTGVLPPVLDQGDCGACWTFAILGAVMSKLKLVTGSDISLSHQELLDGCFNRGSKGGSIRAGYNYIARHGISLAEDYPYEALHWKPLKKQLCMMEIMKTRGCNKYPIPHIQKQSLERQGLLPIRFKCDATLVQDVLEYLG